MGGASLSTRREAKRTTGASLIRTEEEQIEVREAPIEVREARIVSCEAPRKAWEAPRSFGEQSCGISRDRKRVEQAKASLERAR